jgi:hypothetical protein
LKAILVPKLFKKIEDPKYTANFVREKNKHGDLLKCKNVAPIAFHVLIYSILWRAAISKQPIYEHFTLPDIVMVCLICFFLIP